MGFLKRFKRGKKTKEKSARRSPNEPPPESAVRRGSAGTRSGRDSKRAAGGGGGPANNARSGTNAVTTTSPGQRNQSHQNNPSSPQSTADRQHRQQQIVDASPPTLHLLPSLITDLETSPDGPSGDIPARALRTLFSLSESSVAHQENRTRMVREAHGRLVPVLLDFLRRCDRSSSEQYLALLVLNNISIPSDNKRLIAIDYGGAHMLSRLLCIDPSCHLMAIVLVNLSFADAELRRELVTPASSVQLVDALSYALLVSSLTPAEHEERPSLVTVEEERDRWMDLSPRKLLAAAVAEDRRHRPALSELNYDDGNGKNLEATASDRLRAAAPLDGSDGGQMMVYPETARWCLCALKNLTRPSKDALAAHAVMDAGVVPIVTRMVTVGVWEVGGEGAAGEQDGGPSEEEPLGSETCGGRCGWDGADADADVENVAPTVLHNDPSKWDSTSLQDAALFTLLNLSSTAAARPYLRELDAVHTLSLITRHASLRLPHAAVTVEEKQFGFQCLKARMAIGFLLGSEGHFGQSRGSGGEAAAHGGYHYEPAILISRPETHLLVELLANTVHQRAKEGVGGYSAATFSVKGVLFAIRCLLTDTVNQRSMFDTSGLELNTLLLIALAQHAVQHETTIDAEAAEHACFSLYLLSNLGFEQPFLPASFNYLNEAEKVFTSYLHIESVTPAGRHAASQLLLRLRYLVFDGSAGNGLDGVTEDDFELSADLRRDMESIIVEKRTPGEKPRDDICDRPILRSRAPKKGTDKAPWDNKSSVSVFPSALIAVQQLSFGSTKVRHLGAIDDILIANNIANSANGKKTESYNYWWRWQDEVNDEIEGDNDNKNGKESRGVMGLLKRATSNSEEPMSIFGFTCCAADTGTV